MTIYILVNLNNEVVGWSEGWVGMDNVETIQIEIDPTHEFLNNHAGFKYENGEIVKDEAFILSETKREKNEELRLACQNSITNGFFHTFDEVEYWFSLDMEAQQNFSSSYQIMKDQIVNEIVWTVKVDGSYSRVVLTLSMMEEIALAIMLHKTNNIAKFRDILSPLVESAITVEEVNSINW